MEHCLSRTPCEAACRSKTVQHILRDAAAYIVLLRCLGYWGYVMHTSARVSPMNTALCHVARMLLAAPFNMDVQSRAAEFWQPQCGNAKPNIYLKSSVSYPSPAQKPKAKASCNLMV